MSAKDEARYKENYDNLIAQGVDKAWLDANYGQAIENKSRGLIMTAWNTYQEEETKKATAALQTKIDALPDELKNDPTFQSLPNDLKEIAIYNYEVQKANDADKAQKLATALEAATEQADPYWKNIIRVAQDSVLRGIEEAQGDYTSGAERQQRLIEEINRSLASNKEFLTLEQQANLASLSSDLQDQYDTFQRNMGYMGAQKAYELQGLELDYNKAISDIESNLKFTAEEKTAALEKLAINFKNNTSQITEGAANVGLTFSTKRKLAQQRLAEENQGMVESTTRQYNKTMADLESNQAYATAQYGQSVGNINTKYQYQTESAQAQMTTAERMIQEERDRTQRTYAKQIADLEAEAASGNVEAQAQIADLKRKMEASVTSAGRSAEAYLGTENMPTVEGYTPLGDVTGQLYEDRVKDIEARKNALYGDLTQSSLNI